MSPIRSLLFPLALAAALSGGGCARSQALADGVQAGAKPGAKPPITDARGTGMIEGVILHPAKVVPALRICAIGSGAPAEAKRFCIDTRPGQDTYRIEGLPPDEYVVIAAAAAGRYRVAGHMQQVQCIRAPCPDMPRTVTVAAGAALVNIDINAFYEKRDDFPAISFK